MTVDGTDAEAVSAAFGELVSAARENPRPAVLEAICARFRGHYEGDAQTYREQDADVTGRDPLLIARRAHRCRGRSQPA